MAVEIMSGKTKMEYFLWSKIISTLYGPEDIKAVQILMKNKAYQSKVQQSDTRSKSKEKSQNRLRGRLASVQSTQVSQTPKLSFPDFQTIILQKQLCDHVSYISGFMSIF